MISFTGPLKLWRNAEGSAHFMSVPEDFHLEIRAHALLVRRGFGSVKVEVTIKDVTWRTSMFPVKDSGGYFLPVKIDVVRKTGIFEGDDVSVLIKLL